MPPPAFFSNQLIQRTVSGENMIALNSLDSFRIFIDQIVHSPDMVKGIAIDQEVFAKSKLAEKQNSSLPFDSILIIQFHKTFDALPDSGKSIAASYLLGADESKAKDALKNKMSELEHHDSLNLTEVSDIVNKWYSYIMARPRTLMAREYKEIESKMYSIRREMIQMRDGATIQAWVVRRSTNPEKSPAILSFSIYIDSLGDYLTAKMIADYGYTGVVANTRGLGQSAGDVEPFEHDANDAYDIIEWMSKQPWSDGRVGMQGGSYLGFTQWAVAKKLHPALKTIVPKVAVAPGIEFPKSGNIFMSFMMRWIDYVTSGKSFLNNQKFNDEEYWNRIFKKWYAEGRSFRSLDTLSGNPNKIFQRWLDHPAYDHYWQNMIPYKTEFSKVSIPVLTITGYFDDGQPGSMYYYKEHMKYNPDAENYLVIGPYDHFGSQGIGQRNLMGYTIDEVATTYNAQLLGFAWYNYIFKSAPKPAFLKNKVNFEIMGGNEWRHVSSLSEMADDTLTFFINNESHGKFLSLKNVPDSNAFIRQTIDLSDRSDSSSLVSLLGANSQAPIIDSIIPTNNARTFISNPIEKPTVISGSFLASLKVKVNKKDMDIGIALYELRPDGKYFSLGAPFTRNIQRASFANNRSQRALLQAGKKTTIPINTTFITCKKLEKGSRLVLVLGTNKNPDLEINYGSGKNVSDETIADAGEPLQIEWFADSWIKIPVLNK